MALSASETKALSLGRADVSGRVIVEEFAEDGKDEEITRDRGRSDLFVFRLKSVEEQNVDCS